MVPLAERVDGITPDVGTQVRVAHRHLDAGVTE
jgi:hypothetical protein